MASSAGSNALESYRLAPLTVTARNAARIEVGFLVPAAGELIVGP